MTKPWRCAVAAVVIGGVSMLLGCTAGAKKIGSSPDGVKASGVALAAAAADAIPPHTVVPPKAIKWLNFPLGGRGVKAAVIAGDPEKPGPFVLRIKSPAGTKVPPHWHPGDEHLTILSGTFAIGMGDVYDAKALKPLPAGSYALLPRDMHHFARSMTATVVQVHGTGPFLINFVNPADDPRTKAAAR